MLDTLPERITSQLMPITESGCIVWLGHCQDGYGVTYWNGKYKRLHRIVYEAVKGPIHHSLQLDHLCRVRCCVNPDHLEAVTSRENTMRGENFISVQSRMTHCNKGHEFTFKNTYITKIGGRRCRTCAAGANREYRKNLLARLKKRAR